MNDTGRTLVRRYQLLYTLARILRFIGWLIIIIGSVLALISVGGALAPKGGGYNFSFGVLAMASGLISGLVLFVGAGLTGIVYLVLSELIKLFIDLAISSQFTAQRLEKLSPAAATAPDLTGLKDEIAQMTLVLREVSAHTQQTAALLEQATKPRPAAAK